MQLAWQGRFDGFCGVYSACHALCFDSDNYEKHFDAAFYAILRAFESESKLTASKIAGPKPGYTDRELAGAICSTSARSRRSKLAIAFRDTRFKRSGVRGDADGIFASRGSLVVQDNGPRHWIAITGRSEDRSYALFDPDLECPRQSRFRINWDQGLLIGPQDWIEQL